VTELRFSRRIGRLLAFLALSSCTPGPESSIVDTASASQASPPPPPSIERGSAATANLLQSRQTGIVEAVSRVAPSVVSIHVQARRQIESQGFWDFFVPRNRQELIDGFGTGFVLRSSGIIVTNQHVVAGADRITVSLANGDEMEASLLGADPTTDVAVLRVEASDLAVPPIGRTTDLLIGEWVIALGNPYTYLLGNADPTVTAGVVSAIGRNILPTRQQTGLYLDMIQTDAAINPGNSGGPLSNALGEVVGMNSSILSSTGSSVGLGFAIPIERVLRVADEIIRTGSVRRAWVGLEVTGAEAMRDWKSSGGVAVSRVAPGGPAAKAGIPEGAILTEANGRPLRNFLDWEAVKLDLGVGDAITVRLREGNRTLSRRIVTGDLPTVTATRVNVLSGVDLVTVTPAVQSERGLRSERGALIVGITAEVQRQTSLQSGDVIIGIDRTPVTSAQEVAEVINSMRARVTFRVYFERNGQVGFTDLAFR